MTTKLVAISILLVFGGCYFIHEDCGIRPALCYKNQFKCDTPYDSLAPTNIIETFDKNKTPNWMPLPVRIHTGVGYDSTIGIYAPCSELTGFDSINCEDHKDLKRMLEIGKSVPLEPSNDFLSHLDTNTYITVYGDGDHDFSPDTLYLYYRWSDGRFHTEPEPPHKHHRKVHYCRCHCEFHKCERK